MAGTFEFYSDTGGRFGFRLKAGNGRTAAVSEAYTTKSAAKSGIESVRTNAPDAVLVDLAD